MQIHNRKYLKKYRRELRNNSTPAEAILWTALQRKQLQGRKFRRQHSIGNYIVDFYCPSERLVIEVDGSVHDSIIAEEYDEVRTRYLSQFNIRVVRFSNDEIYIDLEKVLEEIQEYFTSPTPP